VSRTKQNPEALLDELIDLCKQAQAENEPEDEALFLKNFLPTRVHYRILEPDVNLVIGDKGSGKTQVFRALAYPRGRTALAALATRHGRHQIDLCRVNWLVGFASADKDFPPGTVIRQFASTRQPVDMQTFWLALLIRVLCRSGDIPLEGLPPALRGTFEGRLSNIKAWYPALGEHLGALFATLDDLDRKLEEEDRHVFVTYDDLDRLSPGDWSTLQTILQGLVQFWAAHVRRYRRLRPKLFLRRDLYERAALFGPDIAKISAHRVELLWTPGELYGVLFKRILNARDGLNAFLGSARPAVDVSEDLGLIPRMSADGWYEPGVERLFGTYMGADPRKGIPFRWIPNHLKDGHRRVYPRPLLRLVENAAEIERRDGKALGLAQLIHHTALRGALDRVSEYRVQELTHEEFPWLRRIQTALAEKPFVVPAERRIVLKSLTIKWPDNDDRPPSTEPADLLDYLVQLGLFQVLLDGRINVGDLYLRGLHLKRKGGVARPRETR
jgi:hypothetical protein